MSNPWDQTTQWVDQTTEKAIKTVGHHVEKTASKVQGVAEGAIATGQTSLKQVQQVTEGTVKFAGQTVEAATQTVDKQVSQATSTVQKTTEGTIAAGQASLKQVQSVTGEAINASSTAIGQTVGAVQEAGANLQQQTLRTVGKGLGQVNQLGQQAQSLTQSQVRAMGQALEQWQTAILAAGASGLVVTQALKDLPRTAQALAQEMPKLARRIQTAGLRTGDGPRSSADVMALFEKIPGTSKLGANERDIRVFLSDKHGSHIHPHSQGGGNGANNILWEVGRDNIRRGAETMTGGEQLYIRFYNAVDSVLKNSTTIAKLGLTATGTAVLTQALVTALSYALDLYRGDITVEEFRDKIIDAAACAGIATPIFFLLFVVVMALFPEVVVILSAPAVVAGFNALFGVGIALPIVQSIIRHLEAGGFGEASKTQYAAAIQQGDEMMQSSSGLVQSWWRDLFNEGKDLSPGTAG